MSKRVNYDSTLEDSSTATGVDVYDVVLAGVLEG